MDGRGEYGWVQFQEKGIERAGKFSEKVKVEIVWREGC
jgi:hypothetical protein